MAEKKVTKKAEEKEALKLSGKFIKGLGRRKTATAQVRLYKNGKGNMIVNDQKDSSYFNEADILITKQSLIISGLENDFDISIVVRGGGKRAQAVAVRHGISRALVSFNKELKPALKASDLMTRDARKKERKKPGLKKARKAPQWSKR